MSEPRYFEVTARVHVLAESENAAIDRVLGALRTLGHGTWPVGDFAARPSEPLEELQARRAAAAGEQP